jgi:hypothetical protein
METDKPKPNVIHYFKATRSIYSKYYLWLRCGHKAIVTGRNKAPILYPCPICGDGTDLAMYGKMREKEIYYHRNNRGMTLQELADFYCVSRERIRQIYARAERRERRVKYKSDR